MNIQITQLKRTDTDERRWERLSSESRFSNYLISMQYEYSREKYGRSTSTFIFTRDGLDIAGVHYSIKKSWGGIFSTADIISGILFREDPEADILKFVLDHFTDFARINRVSIIRVSLWVPKEVNGSSSEYSEEFSTGFLQGGFKQLHSGKHTYWIDLTLPVEKLKMNMDSHTRRRIRKAETAGFTMESIDYFSEEYSEVFYKMYSQLGLQKGFKTLTKERFHDEVKALFLAGATLFLLKFRDEVINISLATNFGISSYYHGAINPSYKMAIGCPSPGHYVQWSMMMYMKQRGIRVYDMAYCPGPSPIVGHPQYDMWRFKYGFGGNHIEYFPTYYKILQPLRGKIVQYLK
jgi:hypothetical protein